MRIWRLLWPPGSPGLMAAGSLPLLQLTLHALDASGPRMVPLTAFPVLSLRELLAAMGKR